MRRFTPANGNHHAMIMGSDGDVAFVEESDMDETRRYLPRLLTDKKADRMEFSSANLSEPCILIDDSRGRIAATRSLVGQSDVTVMVPGEASGRVIAWDKFRRKGGIIVQTED